MTEETKKSTLKELMSIELIVEFSRYIFKRFNHNRCTSIAAELTVTSLLALVPLTFVVFKLLSLLPSFQVLGDQLQSLLFQYFVPGPGQTVQGYINDFVGRARGLSGVGSLMLVVSALLMMHTIDSSFNKIWQVKSKKSMVRTFLVYWAILTLGPILLGSGLLITSYIHSVSFISDAVASHNFGLTLWLPFVMAILAFSVMFYIVPNRKIPIHHAFYSGLLTAILFELAKLGFTLFATQFSSYQILFGAVAVLPLFLIWVYLSWGIVLLGAEFCHGLYAFKRIQIPQKTHPFIQCVQLILALAECQRKGTTLNIEALRDSGQQVLYNSFKPWLPRLVDLGMVSKVEQGGYCLLIAQQQIDYLSIYRAVGRIFPKISEVESAPLPEQQKLQLMKISKNLESSLTNPLIS